MQIAARAPFDFDLSCRIFAGGDPQTQVYEGGVYRHAVRLPGGKKVLLAIASAGSVERPLLDVEAFSDQRFTRSDRPAIEKLAGHIFNLALDLRPFYKLMKSDMVMAPVVRQLRGLRNRSTVRPYEALVSAIIEQQISLIAAGSMRRKLIRTHGDRLVVRAGRFAGEYHVFPEPQKLAAASVAGLMGCCGLSRRKSEYIIGVSQLIGAGELDFEALQQLPDDEVIRRMTAIRGIGRWTAEMTLLRGMNRPGALPADDLGLRRLVSHFYNNDIMLSSDRVRELGDRWGKWKGLAIYYLIVARIRGIAARAA